MILFIDIETAPVQEKFSDLSKELQKHWLHKTQFLRLKEEEVDNPEKSFRGHAGIYAEFSKVICIGLGYYSPTKKAIQTHCITNEEEKELLDQFLDFLAKFKQHTDLQFCGHNIKEFDLPFLCRRLTIHQMPLPFELNLAGLKPWENHHIDTMELWRFGDYKRYTSLDLLAQILQIPSSKTDIDGSQVANVFYEEKDIERIKNYCERDVVTTARIYYRLQRIQVDLSGQGK